MPKWSITQQEFLDRLHIDQKAFINFLHLPKINKARLIVPLRDMRTVESLIPISAKMLHYILHSIRTMNGRRPFYQNKINVISLDPRQLKIGQKFIYRETYQKLLEEVPDMFKHFRVGNGNNLGSLGPYFAFGYTAQEEYAMACYIPPIVEKHGSDLVIMDGIHRNYIAHQAGNTVNAIVISDVKIPFPCKIHDWKDAKVIPLAEKPSKLEERYFGLNSKLFRNLKYFGIDG